MHKLEKFVVELNKERRLRKYHKRSNSIARKALKNIETERGNTDSNIIKKCNEYASDVLGWKDYAPWLYVYAAISGDFKKGWIPDNYYGKIVVPNVNGVYKELSELKSLSNELIKTQTVPDILRVMNGRFFDNEMNELKKNEVKNYLFNSTEKIVFKLDNSIRGRGIWIFDKQRFDIQKVQNMGNGVFQRFIKQHPFFEKFSPTTVITLRLTTVAAETKEVSERAAYLRVGRKEETHLKATSNIRIATDLETGTLYESGFFPNWSSSKIHPDTKEKFSGNQIPKFKEAVETVVNLHKRLPYIMSIGWDVVIDEEENILIMEWNADHNDIKFSEAHTGPCFADLGWEKLWSDDV